jgi:catechol 2,3-dioxygenase-like lactoylglutathione lyase family enzyme
VDWKLELIVLPVSDVDRAKDFYTNQVGFNLDVDHRVGDDFRVVQMTPPGSACSVTIGKGVGDGKPGSYGGMHLVVNDIEAACAYLTGNGVEVGELHHFTENGRTAGPHPDRDDYGTFSSFNDPDGNTWVIQEVGRRA